jgi:hypothetical protein
MAVITESERIPLFQHCWIRAERRIGADGSPIVRDTDGTQINHSGVLFGQAFLVFTFSDGKVGRGR